MLEARKCVDNVAPARKRLTPTCGWLMRERLRELVDEKPDRRAQRHTNVSR
jgi:hypothetical protein